MSRHYPKNRKRRASPPSPPWHAMAREMRQNGASSKAIARALSKSKDQVFKVCRGTTCPIDHRAERLRQNWEKPEFRAAHSRAMAAFHVCKAAPKAERRAIELGLLPSEVVS